MGATAARAGKILGFVALAASSLFVHEALRTGRWTVAAAILSALQVLILGGALLLRSGNRYKWAGAGLALVLVLLAFSWRSAQQNLVATAGLPHAIVYVGLLCSFGASLLPGREALLTTITRRIRGPLPPDITAYTRGVTWAWCGFFAGQLLLSLLLFLFAPLWVWSTFINVLNFPLIVLMFVAERCYRIMRMPNHAPTSIADLRRGFARPAPGAANQPDLG